MELRDQGVEFGERHVAHINIVLIPAFVVLCGIAWGVVRKLKWRRRTA